MLELLERRDSLGRVLLNFGENFQLVGFECPNIIGVCMLKLSGQR